MSRKNPKATKTFIGYYKDYKIYQIVDAADQIFYNASSDYLTSGFVTVVADTMEETKEKIDKIYIRVNLIRGLYQKIK